MSKTTNEKKYVLTGVVLPFNTKSQTGRVYTRESISEEVFSNFVERVKNGGVAGVLEQRHSLVDGAAPLQEISHKVVDAQITDAGVRAEIEVLDTPKGKLVKTILDNGMALWGASRAIGSVEPDGRTRLDQVISFDLTGCPSFDPNQVMPLSLNGQTPDEYAVQK